MNRDRIIIENHKKKKESINQIKKNIITINNINKLDTNSFIDEILVEKTGKTTKELIIDRNKNKLANMEQSLIEYTNKYQYVLDNESISKSTHELLNMYLIPKNDPVCVKCGKLSYAFNLCNIHYNSNKAINDFNKLLNLNKSMLNDLFSILSENYIINTFIFATTNTAKSLTESLTESSNRSESVRDRKNSEYIIKFSRKFNTNQSNDFNLLNNILNTYNTHKSHNIMLTTLLEKSCLEELNNKLPIKYVKSKSNTSQISLPMKKYYWSKYIDFIEKFKIAYCFYGKISNTYRITPKIINNLFSLLNYDPMNDMIYKCAVDMIGNKIQNINCYGVLDNDKYLGSINFDLYGECYNSKHNIYFPFMVFINKIPVDINTKLYCIKYGISYVYMPKYTKAKLITFLGLLRLSDNPIVKN